MLWYGTHIDTDATLNNLSLLTSKNLHYAFSLHGLCMHDMSASCYDTPQNQRARLAHDATRLAHDADKRRYLSSEEPKLLPLCFIVFRNLYNKSLQQ